MNSIQPEVCKQNSAAKILRNVAIHNTLILYENPDILVLLMKLISLKILNIDTLNLVVWILSCVASIFGVVWLVCQV